MDPLIVGALCFLVMVVGLLAGGFIQKRSVKKEVIPFIDGKDAVETVRHLAEEINTKDSSGYVIVVKTTMRPNEMSVSIRPLNDVSRSLPSITFTGAGKHRYSEMPQIPHVIDATRAVANILGQYHFRLMMEETGRRKRSR